MTRKELPDKIAALEKAVCCAKETNVKLSQENKELESKLSIECELEVDALIENLASGEVVKIAKILPSIDKNNIYFELVRVNPPTIKAFSDHALISRQPRKHVLTNFKKL